MSPSPQAIVFVQRRAHRAGAQTSLLRLLQSWPVPGECTLLLGEEGWLAEAARAEGIELRVHALPPARHLSTRLSGALGRVATTLDLGATVFVANTHEELPQALALAQHSGAAAAVFLRESHINEATLLRYRVNDCAKVFAVSEGLALQARKLHCDVLRVNEILLEREFSPPQPTEFPGRWLLGGHSGDDKGWAELHEALMLLPPAHQPQHVDLSDDKAAQAWAVPHSFLGRRPIQWRDHRLLIHPSRSESYGLLVAESIAAGVPVVASRTGWLEGYGWPWTFTPGSVVELADSLRKIREQWSSVTAALEAAQEFLRSTTDGAQAAHAIRSSLRAL